MNRAISWGPADIARIAGDIAASYKLDLIVMDKKEWQRWGMNAALSVSQGSCQPPKFIVLSYKGKKTQTVDLALVGKGITFDSGGISLKPQRAWGI
jgi:leucyl aminopeptidase